MNCTAQRRSPCCCSPQNSLDVVWLQLQHGIAVCSSLLKLAQIEVCHCSVIQSCRMVGLVLKRLAVLFNCLQTSSGDCKSCRGQLSCCFCGDTATTARNWVIISSSSHGSNGSIRDCIAMPAFQPSDVVSPGMSMQGKRMSASSSHLQCIENQAFQYLLHIYQV